MFFGALHAGGSTIHITVYVFVFAIMNTRGIDEYALISFSRFNSQDLMAGCLRSMRSNAELFADECVHQGRFTGIGLTNQRNITCLKRLFH